MNFLSFSDVLTLRRLVAIGIVSILVLIGFGSYNSSFYYERLKDKSFRVAIVNVVGWRDHAFVIDTTRGSSMGRSEEFKFRPVDGRIGSVGINSGMILMKRQGSDTIYVLDSLGVTIWWTVFR